MNFVNNSEKKLNLSEAETMLIKKAIEGDTASFETLVKKHYQVAFNYAMKICKRNEATASDILQESFIKAFVNIKTFKGNAAFSTWLWKIIYHTFLDFQKKKRFQTLPDNLPDVNETDLPLVNFEKEKIVNESIQLLKPPFKDILIMVDMLGYSYEKASKIAGIPVGTIRSRLSRARIELSEILWKHKELFDK